MPASRIVGEDAGLADPQPPVDAGEGVPRDDGIAGGQWVAMAGLEGLRIGRRAEHGSALRGARGEPQRQPGKRPSGVREETAGGHPGVLCEAVALIGRKHCGMGRDWELVHGGSSLLIWGGFDAVT